MILTRLLWLSIRRYLYLALYFTSVSVTTHKKCLGDNLEGILPLFPYPPSSISLHYPCFAELQQYYDQKYFKVLLSFQGEADGKLYMDDGISFDYQNGKYEYREITFKQGKLESKYVGALIAAFLQMIRLTTLINRECLSILCFQVSRSFWSL